MTDNLPTGWSNTSLSSVATLDMGQSPKGEYTNTEGKGIPLVGGASDLGAKVPKATKSTTAPTKICQPNDLILCVRATIGKLNTADKEYCLGRGVAGVRPHISNRWLYRFLEGQAKNIDAAGTGSTFRQVDKKTLSEWDVDLPPLNEQRRIADKIDALMERSGAAKESLDAIPALLDKYRQSVLAAAFRGDLTKDWREQNPDMVLPFLIAPKKKTDDLFHSFGDSQRGKIPKSWQWAKLDELGGVLGGGTPSKGNAEYWGGDIPWISPKDMKQSYLGSSKDMITQQGLEKSSTKSIPAHSVLFVVRGMILAHSFPVAINTKPSTINQDMKAIVPHSYCDPEYLLYALMNLKSVVVGMTASSTHGTKRLEAHRFMNLAIPLPSLVEQRQIVLAVKGAFDLLASISNAFQSTEARLPSLNQSILQKAFRGELVPQDPNDEPASVLLERIQAERLQMSSKRKKRTKVTKKTTNDKDMTANMKRALIEVIREHQAGISAQDLFAASGYKRDVTEDVDAFYAELKGLIDSTPAAIEMPEEGSWDCIIKVAAA